MFISQQFCDFDSFAATVTAADGGSVDAHGLQQQYHPPVVTDVFSKVSTVAAPIVVVYNITYSYYLLNF